jgi:hypothetical protein
MYDSIEILLIDRTFIYRNIYVCYFAVLYTYIFLLCDILRNFAYNFQLTYLKNSAVFANICKQILKIYFIFLEEICYELKYILFVYNCIDIMKLNIRVHNCIGYYNSTLLLQLNISNYKSILSHN